MTLEEADRRVARYAWLERRRFDLLGTWAAGAPEPEAKALLATHALRHAWHGSLWAEHLPRRSGHAGPTADAGEDALVAVVDAAARPRGAGATAERLVGAYRVLAPYAVTAYTQHLALASVISDASQLRTLRLVLADQVEGWQEGEAVLQSLLRTEHDIKRAASHQAALEVLMLAAGGVAGAG